MVPQPEIFLPLEPDEFGPLQEFVRPPADIILPVPADVHLTLFAAVGDDAGPCPVAHPAEQQPPSAAVGDDAGPCPVAHPAGQPPFVAMVDDAGPSPVAQPAEHIPPPPIDFTMPTTATELPPPKNMLPPRLTDRREDVNDATGSRPVSTYGVHLPPARNTPPRPPMYTAMMLRGPNNKAIEFFGMYDGGSNRSLISPSLATMLGITPATDSVSVNMIHKNDRAVSYWTKEGVTLWHGRNHAVYLDALGIMDMPPDSVPYFLLSRDLAATLGIKVLGLKHKFPRELRGDADDGEFKDLNDRTAQRVSDVDNISVEMSAARDPVRHRLQEELDALRRTVRVDSFINHPRAVVQILHTPGTPPAYRKQYGGKHKSLLDGYITAQVELWLQNGKLVKWDEQKHGYSPTFNMPLLPVVTRTPSGQIKKVRVCVDARHINVGIVNDDTPLPNISRLFSDMASNKWFSEFDMESAFNQFPVDVDSQHKLAIHWEGQVYCFAGAPFGIKHISAHARPTCPWRDIQ